MPRAATSLRTPPRLVTRPASARKKPAAPARATATATRTRTAYAAPSRPAPPPPTRRPALKVVPGRARPAVAGRSVAPAPVRPVLKVTPPPPPPTTPPAVRAAAGSEPVTYNKNDLLRRFAPLVRHVVERVA